MGVFVRRPVMHRYVREERYVNTRLGSRTHALSHHPSFAASGGSCNENGMRQVDTVEKGNYVLSLVDQRPTRTYDTVVGFPDVRHWPRGVSLARRAP